MKQKLFFKSVDDTMCYSLEGHLLEAKADGLGKVKLIEAVPDNGSNDHIWCSYYGEAMERVDCTKASCQHYEANKSGRGTCINRGKFYLHGEEIEFDVLTGEEIPTTNL